jgi:hypothetical protein
MKDLIYEIVVEDYPSKIQLSEKRRAVYFQYKKHKDKLPKKYQEPQRYKWSRDDGYLYDLVGGKRVVKNSKSVGTPKFWSVNFQAIWNQQIKYQGRALIMNKLKDIFNPYIKDLEPITEFPIRIELFLLDQEMPVDVDNKGVVYTKCITDLLTNNNIIPDDSSDYVNDTGRCKWVKINESETTKMIIKIWKSNNSLV